MTHEEFRRLADTWGGDIERWPAPRQVEARQHAATEEGAAVLANGRRLDVLLKKGPEVTPERAGRVALAVIQRIAAEDEGSLRRGAWLLPNWLIPACRCGLLDADRHLARNDGALSPIGRADGRAERDPGYQLDGRKLGDPMMRKWTRLGSPQTILLLVSLCLNVLMGSYIAKQWFEFWSPPLTRASPPRLIQLIARRLPAEDAEKLGPSTVPRSQRFEYRRPTMSRLCGLRFACWRNPTWMFRRYAARSWSRATSASRSAMS